MSKRLQDRRESRGSLHPVCSVWGCLWRSKNALDGLTEHLLYDGHVPALFRDRKSARQHIKSKYGYILRRPDLREEPHGWMLPVAVRVEVYSIGLETWATCYLPIEAEAVADGLELLYANDEITSTPTNAKKP